MKLYSLTFMQSVSIEISLRSSIVRNWELYRSAQSSGVATSAFLDAVRCDVHDYISALRAVTSNR